MSASKILENIDSIEMKLKLELLMFFFLFRIWPIALEFKHNHY